MRLEFCRLVGECAEAGTVKDAGDDPDVTHGALLYTRVRLLGDRACVCRWQRRRHRDPPGAGAGGR